MHTAQCTLCKSKGNATNDQPDVSCKGIRETGMQSCINVYNVHVHVYTHIQVITYMYHI